MDDVTLIILCVIGLTMLPLFLYGISIWLQLLGMLWEEFALLLKKIIVLYKNTYESYSRIRASRRGRRASDRL
jgi:hypothetical protein